MSLSKNFNRFCLIFIFFIFEFCTVSRQESKRINKDFNYFQKGLDSSTSIAFKELKIQKSDLMSIQVLSNSLNQEQVHGLNIVNTGGFSQLNGIINQNLSTTVGYLVDQDGYIIFPLIGLIKIEGLTRKELADTIRKAIERTQIIKEPTVLVRFLQLKISVLGEVKNPGTKIFNTDRITILDALAAANDLSDKGRRDNITIIREEDGHNKTIYVDLRDANFLSKEGYQLKQNDIVYISANKFKLKEVNTDPNILRDIQIGLFATSVLSLIINSIYLINR